MFSSEKTKERKMSKGDSKSIKKRSQEWKTICRIWSDNQAPRSLNAPQTSGPNEIPTEEENTLGGINEKIINL